MNTLTKEQIIEKANTEYLGFFLDTDGIRYDLDGLGMAVYLKSIGFNVTRNYDARTNGFVITSDGVKVSTNGFVSPIK